MATEPRPVERHLLPDGSVCLVEPIGHSSSLVAREVGGVCTWGQAFSCEAEAHPAQVARVVASMTADPAAFVRWYHAPAVAAQAALEAHPVVVGCLMHPDTEAVTCPTCRNDEPQEAVCTQNPLFPTDASPTPPAAR